MLTTTEILTADEAWVALALLHRRHPDREAFSAKEIMDEARVEKAHTQVRAGLQAHIYLHNVANIAPNSARYRMFFKTPSGQYRLFRHGDECHPDRKGKIAPKRDEFPSQYHHLLSWYEKDYSGRVNPTDDEQDPVLQMWGVGKEIWREEGGDAFIARERAEFDREMDTPRSGAAPNVKNLRERVWARIVEHQGEEFRTITNKSFTHSVEGDSGIWFYRNGKRIEKRLWRGHLDQAIAMCPVSQPVELKGFMDPSYLFGLLRDSRIRGTDW